MSILESLIFNVFSGIPRPAGKGPRCILIGLGSEEGWVLPSVQVWKHTKQEVKSDDYHNDINFEGFEKWLKESCLPHLPPNSVIVMDNASYHSKKDEENR